MSDDTKREIDAEVEQAAAEKRDAGYAAKLTTCGVCGREGPEGGLHVCHRYSTPEAARPCKCPRKADGEHFNECTDERPWLPASERVTATPGIEAEREAEEMTPATLQDFLEIVDKHGSALMTPGDRIRYAKLMLGRHPVIERAYRAGLRQGRDLREQAKRGMGWIWPELEDLTPRERTFVLGRVRDEVMGSH